MKAQDQNIEMRIDCKWISKISLESFYLVDWFLGWGRKIKCRGEIALRTLFILLHGFSFFPFHNWLVPIYVSVEKKFLSAFVPENLIFSNLHDWKRNETFKILWKKHKLTAELIKWICLSQGFDWWSLSLFCFCYFHVFKLYLIPLTPY